MRYLIILITLSSLIFADKLYMKNGNVFEGTVQGTIKENNIDYLVLSVSGNRINFALITIDRLEDDSGTIIFKAGMENVDSLIESAYENRMEIRHPPSLCPRKYRQKHPYTCVFY